MNIIYTYFCVWWNGKLQSNHNETMAIEAIVHFFSFHDYCLFEQVLPPLSSIWARTHFSQCTRTQPVLRKCDQFLSSSLFNNHLGFPCILKSLRDKKFRPRIGKLQWRPKWMKRYFKSSPPTSFCRLLRLLLFYKFVDFILFESPLKLLFNKWYQVQVKYFRSIYFSRGGTSGLPGWCFPGMRSKSGFLSKEIIAHKMRFFILKAVGVNSIQHFPWSHCSCNRQIDHLEN